MISLKVLKICVVKARYDIVIIMRGSGLRTNLDILSASGSFICSYGDTSSLHLLSLSVFHLLLSSYSLPFSLICPFVSSFLFLSFTNTHTHIFTHTSRACIRVWFIPDSAWETLPFVWQTRDVITGWDQCGAMSRIARKKREDMTVQSTE